MPSNKNQHFVPRCHLRRFAQKDNSDALCLYNLDRKRAVPVAAIKHQCSGDYFYGEDQRLEDMLQSIERSYSSLIREIHSEGYIFEDSHKESLLLFWLMQYMRTEAAAKRAVEAQEEIRIQAQADISEFNLGIKEAVQVAMRAFSEQPDAVEDLKVCLVKNKTDHPFITSDNPAIITNRWHFQKCKPRMGFGAISSGLIVMLPLSPDVLMIGYDGDIHSILHKKGWIDVKTESDVIALNQHQFLNCNSNVYYHSHSHSDWVRANHENFIKEIPDTTYRLHYTIPVGETSEGIEYRKITPSEISEGQEVMVINQRIYPIPKVWPSFLSWRHKRCYFSNDTATGFVRYYWARDDDSPYRKIKA
jgi:hypothetical protein